VHAVRAGLWIWLRRFGEAAEAVTLTLHGKQSQSERDFWQRRLEQQRRAAGWACPDAGQLGGETVGGQAQRVAGTRIDRA
jgi:hypothetical protein